MLSYQEIIDLQDKFLVKAGEILKGSLLSGSFALARAYTQHRTENTVDVFYTGGIPDLPEQIDEFTLQEKKKITRWEVPQTTESTVYSYSSKNRLTINLRLTPDILEGVSGKTPLEIGFFLEDLEGIYYRILLDYLHNPEDFMLALDIAYIDNEYHLVDFFSHFQERFPDFSEEKLRKSFEKTKLQMEKNPFEVKRAFSQQYVNISDTVLKKWLEAKIQEFSE